jgi:hypothetical protein
VNGGVEQIAPPVYGWVSVRLLKLPSARRCSMALAVVYT